MNGNNGLHLFLESTWTKLSEVAANSDKVNHAEKYIHVVLGNESGDLDSIVSAVAYSYFLQKQSEANSNDLFVPVLNFNKDDIILKTEVNAIFEKFGITTNSLVFKDGLTKLLPGLKDVTLVDHNELSSELSFLHDLVINIIDHHSDSGSFDDPYISKTIEAVGSCCTLVSEKIYNKSESLLAEFPLADVLLSTILLDTVNLKQGIGRSTEKDIEFVEELEQYATCPSQELFDIAQKAKYSILHLSVNDILRKDLKTFSNNSDLRIGVSSVTASAKDFLSKKHACKGILEFAAQNSLRIIIVMCIHTKEDIAIRELAICSSDSSLSECIISFLLEKDDLELHLQSDLDVVKVFSQGNSKVSRKLLSPYIINFLNDETKAGRTRNSILDGGIPAEFEDRVLHATQNYGEKQIRKSNGLLVIDDADKINFTSELNKCNAVDSVSSGIGEDAANPLDVDADIKINDLIDRSFEVSPPDLVSQTDEELLLHQGIVSDSLRAHDHLTVVRESQDDISIEQPSLEYDESWKLNIYEVKSPDVSDGRKRKHKIVLRDLSFDDNATLSELTRIDLLCPVFLAVTEDEEDDDYVLKDIRRKTKSIENLCSTLDEEQDFPLRRTKSELPSKFKARKGTPARKRERVLSSSESTQFNRNDSIKEENDGDDENPFLGDKELGCADDDQIGDEHDDEDKYSFNTSSTHDSQNFQDSCEWKHQSNAEDEAFQPGKPYQPNGTRGAVVSFSFSDDESHSNETDQSQKKSVGSFCSCSQSSMTDIMCCPHHVKGLWDRFITVSVGGLLKVVDLKLIDPYVKVITHGGFHETVDGRRVVMVFTAEFLPKKYIPKYAIIMEQLFYYAVHTIDLSVQNSYEIVYFNARGSNQPGNDWLKKCYDMVERRLNKNLSTLYIVHPNFWLKTMVRLYKPFMSSKFSRNIEFIKSLRELKRHLSLEYIFIPDEVKRLQPWTNALTCMQLLKRKDDNISLQYILPKLETYFCL